MAAVIERDSPDIVANRPELLAYHYSQAGNSEFAVRYWLEGGERARSRSANLEAIGQFQKALEYLHFLPETAEREATELKTQLSLGVCFIAVRGYEADDTRKSFERACVLSAGLGESTKEIQAISGLWGHYWMRARHDRALELGKMLLVKAEPLDDPVPLIVGNRALGSTLFTLGDFVSAREHLEQALSLSRQATAEDLSSSYAVNPQIAARLMLGWDLWILGYPDQALDHVRQAFEEATDLAHPYSVAFTHYVTSAIHLLRGEPRDSIVHADRSLEISREHRINLYAIYSRFGRGCALAEMSRPDDAISEIQGGIEEARRSNLGYMRGFMLGWLASVLAETGEREAAMATVDDAIKGTDDVSGRAWESELHRLRGTILLAAHVGVHDDSERCFNKAIAVARRQGARSLELRATTELSRLWQGQGKTRQARDLLAPVHDWFTEGLDTADLKEAKALLEDLS